MNALLFSVATGMTVRRESGRKEIGLTGKALSFERDQMTFKWERGEWSVTDLYLMMLISERQ